MLCRLACSFLWQFHDGLGFLTNHGVLSNTFEASLQTVNPKLTLPYWDFTIETSSAGVSGDNSGYQPQTNTPIFQESWFGTVDHTDDMVSSGWVVGCVRLPLPKASKGSPCVQAYVRLRISARTLHLLNRRSQTSASPRCQLPPIHGM